MQLDKVTLTGKQVRLEPLTPTHLSGLGEAISDRALWQIPVTFVPHDHLEKFLVEAGYAQQSLPA